jgi:4-amino-4-deoxychorismate lyase
MKRAVAVLGTGVVQANAAVLAADDLGLTRGDGCFEATRVATDPAGNHRIDQLEEHLDRFGVSCASLDLPAPDRVAWCQLIEELLRSWDQPGEAMLRLMLSRGRESPPQGPVTGIATLTPMAERVLRQRHNGIAVISLGRGTASAAYADAPWLLGGVKTLSYAINVAAIRLATARGADDVIFTSTDGFALEAPTATVVWQAKNSLWTTPTGDTGILPSITQRVLFDAAAHDGLDTGYALTTLAELCTADGVWLVSSGRGVAAVHSLDGRHLSVDADLTARITRLAGF